MSLELSENLDLSGARDVQLGGRRWKVAPLSLRQILAIADHVPRLSAISVETISGERIAPLAEVVWHGLRRAYPTLSREEFFDLPITIGELVVALPIVIEQAGGRRLDIAGEGDASAGEAQAASASTASTGVRSSPTS